MRIITWQRQARELGRLRSGFSEMKPTRGGEMKPQPVKSPTWILTSSQREYLDAAVELGWGGEVETWQPQGNRPPEWRLITNLTTIDALLPPGDPVSQSYEKWTGGGCERRCDGETERIGGLPCLCLKEYGTDFHTQDAKKVCKPYTRLNVVIPQLPDIGYWVTVTKGFYAGIEITAQVDLIQLATEGRLVIPVALGIEQRSTIDEGKRRNYQVTILQVRGTVAGPMLAAAAQRAAIAAGAPAPAVAALAAGPTPAPPDFYAEIAAATTAAELNTIRDRVRAAGVSDDALLQAWRARGQAIKQAGQQAPPAQPAAPAPAPEPARTAEAAEPAKPPIWNECVALAGTRGWSIEQLRADYANWAGFPLTDPQTTGWVLAQYLDVLRGAA